MVSEEPPALNVVPSIATSLGRGKATAPFTDVIGGSALKEGRLYELPPTWIRLEESTKTGVPDIVTGAASGVTKALFMYAPFEFSFIARPPIDIGTSAAAGRRRMVWPSSSILLSGLPRRLIWLGELMSVFRLLPSAFIPACCVRGAPVCCCLSDPLGLVRCGTSCFCESVGGAVLVEAVFRAPASRVGLGTGANGVGSELLIVVVRRAEFIATAISKVLGGSKAVKNTSEQFPYQGSISFILLGNAINGR